MSRPPKHYLDSQNSIFGPQKEPKTKSKNKNHNERSTENNSFPALWLTPKTVFYNYPGPK